MKIFPIDNVMLETDNITIAKYLPAVETERGLVSRLLICFAGVQTSDTAFYGPEADAIWNALNDVGNYQALKVDSDKQAILSLQAVPVQVDKVAVPVT